MNWLNTALTLRDRAKHFWHEADQNRNSPLGSSYQTTGDVLQSLAIAIEQATLKDPSQKTAYLWVVDFGSFVAGANQAPDAKPMRHISADLFFSSLEKFLELYTCSDAAKQQLVQVQVPVDFDHWDFIPDNY